MNNLTTPRLELVPATLELLEAELTSPEHLASGLDAVLPEGWPPGQYDRPAISYFRTRLAEHPDDAGWYGWYAIQRDSGSHNATVIGVGGFFGPPTAEHEVEIGYSIVPSFESRGYATELVRALVHHAFSSQHVLRVIAHTTPGNTGSIRVLEKAGVSFVGAGQDPGTVQYESRHHENISGDRCHALLPSRE